MITRRSFAATLAAGAAIPALARSTRAQTQAQTTLDVFYAFPSFARFHEPVAAEFMRANPTIHINFRAPAPSYDEGHQTMVRQALTNQLPDVFYSGFHLLPELARTLVRREQIVPLDPLLAAEGAAFRSANYADRLLDLGKVDGQLYGLAFNASNPIVYFNADLVRSAGGNPDAFPQDWAGVTALAQRINKPADGVNGMAYDVHGWPDGWLFEAMITQAGGSLLNAERTDIAFDGPVGLAALRTFRRFVTDGGMQLIDWDQSRQQFGAGKIGIYVASPANLQQVTGLVADKFALRTTTFPIDDRANGRIPTGGNAVIMTARDPAKRQAAWTFLKYVTGPEAQKVVVQMTGYLPTNVRAAGPEFLGPWYEQNPNARAPILQIDRAGPWGAYPGGNNVRIWRTQRDLITAVMRGELTPEAGLARIASETRTLMR
jgi:multiple sugar transport system substrate-binding protein